MIPEQIVLHTLSRQLELVFAGQHYRLDAEYLRVHSPSAEVRGHGADIPKLVTGKEMVGIRALEPVGHYALKIIFDDGHDSGLYSWAYLHELATRHAENWAAYLARLEQEGGRRQSAIIATFKEL